MSEDRLLPYGSNQEFLRLQMKAIEEQRIEEREASKKKLKYDLILSSLQGSVDKILAHALEHNVDIKDAAVAYIRVAMTLADGAIEMMEKEG